MTDPAARRRSALPARPVEVSVAHAPDSPRDAAWLRRVRDRLAAAAAQDRARSLPAPALPGVIDLRNTDYLGLRRHPRVLEAAARGAARAAGAGASRLIASNDERLLELETRLARFKGAEAALLTPTGYMANLAAFGALVQPGDLVLGDRLNHASLIDAARLAGASQPRAAFRAFRHLDVDHAASLAERYLARNGRGVVWIATDAVFSMDGDLADLRALAALRDWIDARATEQGGAGAALIVDEAHATGVLGSGGAGLDAACGHVADVVISTASKALGALGGVISGPQPAIDAVVNFARPFIYTTGVAPSQVEAVHAALDVLRDEPHRLERLRNLTRGVRAGVRAGGWPIAGAETQPTPIIALPAGSEADAIALSERLQRAGVLAPAIRPPTVKPGASRVRLSLHADLSDDDVAQVIRAAARN